MIVSHVCIWIAGEQDDFNNVVFSITVVSKAKVKKELPIKGPRAFDIVPAPDE